MGKGGGSQRKNMRKQHEMDMRKWEYNWQKMQDNYQYKLDMFDIQTFNQQQSIDYKNEQAKNDWIYKEEMRRFDYNNQVAAFNASLESYEKQMDYNNMAYELTSNDNTRKYNERLTAIGFQNEEMFNKYGFNIRAQKKELDAKVAEKSMKGQEMMIKSIQQQGALLATGATGRSARKNVQSAIADYGRQQSYLADSVLRDRDAYEFGMEKAGVEFNLGKRQLQESMKSAKEQFAADQQNAALQKYSADLGAESKIAPEPVLPPQLPKPLELPVPKNLEPQAPPSWDQYKKTEPIKGSVSGGGLVGAVQTGLQVASTVMMLTAGGSDDRFKYNLNRVGTSPSGIPKYTFKYRLDGPHGPTWTGTSAQDLLAMGREDAVFQKEKDGFYYVDYSKLDVDFEQVQLA